MLHYARKSSFSCLFPSVGAEPGFGRPSSQTCRSSWSGRPVEKCDVYTIEFLHCSSQMFWNLPYIPKLRTKQGKTLLLSCCRIMASPSHSRCWTARIIVKGRHLNSSIFLSHTLPEKQCANSAAGKEEWTAWTTLHVTFPFFFFSFLSTSPLQNTDKDVLHNQPCNNEKKQLWNGNFKCSPNWVLFVLLKPSCLLLLSYMSICVCKGVLFIFREIQVWTTAILLTSILFN